MKKNRMMRLASVLMVAVMMTTCTISGTFAKYTTSATANDSARVAKWGVAVTAYGDTETIFGEKYDDAVSAGGVKVVSVGAADDAVDDSVLAPGTNGTLGGITVSGTPEVMVDVKATATLTLTGWTTDGGTTEYCPLVFTVTTDGGTPEEIKIDPSNPDLDSVAELAAAVVAKFDAKDATNVAVGTDLARSVSVAWSWPFSTSTENDAKDTILGNLTGAEIPQISFSNTIEVTQVD